MRRDLLRLTVAVDAKLGPDLRALLLVGGYARGEGGAVETPTGFAPYNDYDLIAVMRRGEAAARATLTELGERWTRELGVAVDFWVVSEELAASPPATLFWLDVALGGVRVLSGDPAVIDGAKRLRPRAVPLDEAGRLLANRAVGLALSNLAPCLDQVAERHIHKMVLAVGDARLLAADRYHGTVRERRDELARLAPSPAIGPELVEAYAAAAAFRERPDLHHRGGAELERWYAASRERLARWHLDFEAQRAGTPRTPLGYATVPGRLYGPLPDTSPARAFASALRASLRLHIPLLPWIGHPRERVARAAVALAYAPCDRAARAVAARLLGARALGPDLERMVHDDDLRSALLALIPFGG